MARLARRMSAPRVTIGLCVYNGEAFLAETIDGYLRQTFADFELIISDNASRDRTPEIAQSYLVRDRRVRYTRNPTNLGVSGNYNRVFRMARGEYFKWGTADDVCLPSYLQRCVEVLDRHPDVVLAYPRTMFIDESGGTLNIEDPGWDLQSDSAAERLRYAITAGHWVNSVIGVIRRENLASTGLMPIYAGGDFHLLGELCLQGKFYEVPETLFLRRIHPRASSQNTNSLGWMAEYLTGKRNAAVLPFTMLCRDQLRCICTSSLSLKEKLSLGALVLRKMYSGHQRLSRELRLALGSALARLVSHEGQIETA